MDASGEHTPSRLLDLEITSEPAQCATVRAAVEQTAVRMGFPEEEVNGITLAVNEAIVNVIAHGYRGRSGQPIRVSAHRVMRGVNPAIEITISDCAPQVDPQTIRGRDLEDVRPGGLGTHIIRSFMDEVEYSRRQPRGMQLRLLKFLKGVDCRAGMDR